MRKQQEQKIAMMYEITKLDDSTRACIREIEESVLLIDSIYKAIEELIPNAYSTLGELGITQLSEWLSDLTKIKERSLWMISQLKMVIYRCECLEMMSASDVISADSISGLRLAADTISDYQADISIKLKEVYTEIETTRRSLC